MRVLSTLLLYISIYFANCTVDYLQHPVKSCHIGDLVENECNKCLCTSKRIFECALLDCDKSKNQKDLEATKQLCYPNQLYVQNLITCICTKDGRWPHKSCHETFMSLAPSNVKRHKCQPNSYVPIDCNVCRCGPDGEINSDRCTRNICEDENKRRTNTGTNSVYSNCEVKNWYSLAPCQFCFCVNQNKLVCNTGNYYSKKLELGSYNLRVCGKELIREAIELIPDNQKMLRLGFPLHNISTARTQRIPITPRIVPTSPSIVRVDHSIAIEVNRESNENKTSRPEQLMSSSKEYYTDTEEELQAQSKVPVTLKTTPPTRTTTIRTTVTTAYPQVPSTKFPIQDGDDTLSESEHKSEDDNDEDSNEIVVEIEQTSYTPTIKTTHNLGDHTFSGDKNVNRLANAKSAESYQYVGNTLKINLPKVLNKVFQLALRKSMVSLNNESKCTPGSTSINNCNMCFCLKNSKLLCTNNKCNGGLNS